MSIRSLEQLEEDLREDQELNKQTMSELDELFGGSSFQKKENMNSTTWQTSKGTVKAQFDIDNTTYNYSCYITDTEGTYNMSRKGDRTTATDSAIAMLEELEDYLNKE